MANYLNIQTVMKTRALDLNALPTKKNPQNRFLVGLYNVIFPSMLTIYGRH